MKNQVLFLLSFLFLNCFSAQEKHALLVGISEYQNFSKLPALSSSKDMVLVEKMLNKQKFESSNILKLYEKEATYDGMHNAFKKLLSNVGSGDIVYYHFSGHGCQIMDHGDIDEEDGYDEAMLPFDAPNYGDQLKVSDKIKGYFTDDEFNFYLNRLREKLGKEGQIVVVMDCCHSGTGTRDIGSKDVGRGFTNPVAPNGYKPQVVAKKSWSDMDNKHELAENLASLTSYYGCRASQVNYEYYSSKDETRYGSLTYFFIEALNQLDDNATHNNLYSKINQLHQQRKSSETSQNMLYESDDKNTLIFNGEFLSQKNYFSLEKMNKSSASLTAGSIHGLIEGDTIGFFKNSEMTFERDSAIFFGTIGKVDVTECTVNFLEFRNRVTPKEFLEYRARKVANGTSSLKLNVQVNFNDKQARKNIELVKEKLSSLDFVHFVESNSDIILQDTMINGKVHAMIQLSSNGEWLRNFSPVSINPDDKEFGCLITELENEIQVKNFLETQSRIDNPELKVDVQIPMFDTIVRSGEKFNISIKNNSDFPIYWNMKFIGPNHKIFPDEEIPLKSINPNESFSSENEIWGLSCNGADGTCGQGRVVFMFSNEKIENYSSILDLEDCGQDRNLSYSKKKEDRKFETQEFVYEIHE